MSHPYQSTAFPSRDISNIPELMGNKKKPDYEKLRQGTILREDFPSDEAYQFWKDVSEVDIDPKTPHLPEKVHPNSLSEARRKLSDVVEFLESHKGTMLKTACLWLITDTHGHLIRVIHNNTKIDEIERSLPLSRGVSLALKDVGINAISKALYFKTTRICVGAEHSLEIMRSNTGIGSPLFDVDGTIRACLAFYSPAEQTNPTLARLYMFTVLQSLDQRRRLNRMRHEEVRLNQLHAQMLSGNRPNGLFLSPEGRVIFAGEDASKTFSIKNGIVGKLLDDLFTLNPPLPEILARPRMTPEILLESDELSKTWKAQVFPVRQHENLAGLWFWTLEENTGNDDSNTENPFSDLLGQSPPLLRARNLAEQLAPSEISVLLIGPSGTGKEVFAKGIHQASSRRDGPFVSLNCGALPKDLAESELFGYAPGAFTGALKDGKEGLMESAAEGTLFLDEIGDMPMELQVKLLRVLETQALTRLGETEERPLDLRLIAATHRNLLHLVERGSFREDLYFRLAASTILIPSLKDIPEDIPTIFLHYLDRFCRRNGKSTPKAPNDLLSQLSSLQWRGNVRELRNAAEYAAAVVGPNQELDIGHLPGLVRLSILFPEDGSEASDTPTNDTPEVQGDFHESETESESAKWARVHRECRGDTTRMMKTLSVSRATLYRKLRKYNLLKRDSKERGKAL